MSKYFEKIKAYYQKGIYKVEHLEKLLSAGAITQDEFSELTGNVTE